MSWVITSLNFYEIIKKYDFVIVINISNKRCVKLGKDHSKMNLAMILCLKK